MRYLLLLVVLLSGIGLAEQTDKVVMSELSVSEDIYPGGSFEVSFKIRNIYDWDIKDVNIQVIGGYPLVRVSPRNISHIEKLLSHRSSEVISTDFSVEPDAISGDYGFFVDVSFITFAYNTEAQTYTTRIPVTVHVLGSPWMVVDMTSSIPEEISNGDAANISIRIWNNGSGKAKDVWLDLKDTEDVDIAFQLERNYLGDIESGKSTILWVPLKLEDTAPSGLHDITAELSYSDEYGNEHRQETDLIIESKKEADFSIEAIVAERLSPDSKDNIVRINVKNTGEKKAEDIRLSLVSRYPFFATGKTFYIEELDKGGSAVVGFHVNVDENAAAQKYPVDVQIEWKEGETKKSSLERFAIEVTERSGVSAGLYDRFVVKKDPRLFLSLLGLLLFFGILLRVRRTR